MQWDNQAEANLNGWLNTSQKVWENWWDTLAGSTQNGKAGNRYPGLPMFNMTYNLWNEILKQWQSSLNQTLQSFSPEMSQEAYMAMHQFMFGQEYAQQLLKMTADAWQTILVTASSPDEWQHALETYLTQLRTQMADATDVTKFFENNVELWQLFGQEMQKLSQPWMNVWMQFPYQMNQFAGADEKVHPFVGMMNLTWDAYYQSFGRMTNMPSIGLMREFNEKINRTFTIWQESQRVSLEYQTILGDATLNAFEAYLQKLLETAKVGEMPGSQSELLTLWVEVADEVFIELFHSDIYATTQSRYVNSSMALRQHQRELTEMMLRMNDLPTRSDLDEAHKNIFALRKEVKALKKALEDVKTAEVPSTGVTIGAATEQPSGSKRKTPRASSAKSPRAKSSGSRASKGPSNGKSATATDKGASV